MPVVARLVVTLGPNECSPAFPPLCARAVRCPTSCVAVRDGCARVGRGSLPKMLRAQPQAERLRCRSQLGYIVVVVTAVPCQQVSPRAFVWRFDPAAKLPGSPINQMIKSIGRVPARVARAQCPVRSRPVPAPVTAGCPQLSVAVGYLTRGTYRLSLSQCAASHGDYGHRRRRRSRIW